MFKAIKAKKNKLSCNEMILKGMIKRRKLSAASISKICDREVQIRVVK